MSTVPGLTIMHILTAERLREVLEYDPETGEFRWKLRISSNFSSKRAGSIWNSRFAGKIAGCLTEPSGYVVIAVDSINYRAHRLAFLWMTGEWPKNEIDHRDMCRHNNIWSNLREATSGQNKLNKKVRSDSSTGIKGVGFCKKRKKYRVDIKACGKWHWIGYFDEKEKAAAAYQKASIELHGEFARSV